MTTKQMQFEVDQNILTKIPRYFGGKRSILRELFQNSFRANAKNVTITITKKISCSSRMMAVVPMHRVC